MSEIDKEDMKSYQDSLNSEKDRLYTKFYTLKDLIKSRMAIYEAYEGAESIDLAVYSDMYACSKFIDDQVNALNILLSTYEDLIGTMKNVIKELDTKNIYNIDQIITME